MEVIFTCRKRGWERESERTSERRWREWNRGCEIRGRERERACERDGRKVIGFGRYSIGEASHGSRV